MLAKRMENLEASGIRKFFELSKQMKNPVDLSLGQAHFDVPLPVKEAMTRAVQEGKNGYTVTTGVPELQRAVAASLKNEGLEPESLLVTAGAEGGLVLSLLALADDSCEVLVPDPYFATYNHVVRLCGARPRWIDTYPDFRLTPEKLKAAYTDKCRILLFNSPVNPTGVAYTKKEIQALAACCKQLGLQVISDEVYERFCYDRPHASWMEYDPDCVLVRAFSKSLGMAGWRVGFAAGPKAIIGPMTMLQQFTFICSNAPAQYACAHSFSVDLPNPSEEYRKKRDRVVEALEEAFSFERPEGAFYIFPQYPGGDGERFMRRCIEEELLVVPGQSFSQRNTHFRISFANNDKTLERGLAILLKIAGEMK